MYHPFKKIRIAVVGPRSSGKSFLLYDLIHAFSILGYKPEELPLSYPHSSFGAFFYDIFNSETGGMMKTEGICRPNNHYGAYLSGNFLPVDLPVDFLNIPGEVFDDSENRIDMFFELKQLMEDMDEDMFYLSEWESPSHETVKLILPKGFFFGRAIKSTTNKRSSYLSSWENIRYELENGKYKDKGNSKKVSGEYIFEHITELNIDSLILTLKSCWSKLSRKSNLEWADLEGKEVIHYFYYLAYCNLATDIVLCDNLTDDTNITNLEEDVCFFFKKSQSVNTHIYFAFRASDTIIQKKPEWHRQYVGLLKDNQSGITSRDGVYSLFLTHLQQAFEKKDQQLEDSIEHIERSLGDSYWSLLNYAYQKNSLQRLVSRKPNMYELRNIHPEFLPPHVYFTATPINDHFSIFENDTEDVTRFYYQDGRHCLSFTREVLADMSRHMCFGSLQLLTDILLQNDILPFWSSSLKQRSKLLKYFQYQF